MPKWYRKHGGGRAMDRISGNIIIAHFLPYIYLSLLSQGKVSEPKPTHMYPIVSSWDLSEELILTMLTVLYR